MTSTPISAGIKSYFPGPQGAQASSSNDIDGSFSDLLKNQKNDAQKDAGTVNADKGANQVKPERRAEKISPGRNRDALQKKNGGPETEDTAVQTEEAVQAAAAQMVTQTAAELNIPEDEVLRILDDLSMTPVDLLSSEGLQQVVLANAGETDATVLVTDEELFGDFKELTEALGQVTEEVAAGVGIEPEKLQNIFEEAANRSKEVAVQTDVAAQETAAVTIEAPEETVEKPDIDRTQNRGQIQEIPEEAVAADAQETQKASPKTNEGERDTQGGTDKKDHPGKENTVGSFDASQTVREVFVKEEATVSEAPRFSEETERIMNQITDYMKGQVKEGMSELEMQLHPESLGTLHIRLTAKDGAVTAQFTAQNDTVKAVLEGQMIQLKENFKEQGITVEAIEVAVESHRFDENLHQDSQDSQNNQGQPARPRARRINLNISGTEEDLTEEEQLAAEVLRASGGTVDYQA